MLDWHSCQICYPLEIKILLLLLLLLYFPIPYPYSHFPSLRRFPAFAVTLPNVV